MVWLGKRKGNRVKERGEKEKVRILGFILKVAMPLLERVKRNDMFRIAFREKPLKIQ